MRDEDKSFVYGIATGFIIVLVFTILVRTIFLVREANAQIEIITEQIDFSNNPFYPMKFENQRPLEMKSSDNILLEKSLSGIEMLSIAETREYEKIINEKIDRLNYLVSHYSMLYDSCKNK